MPLQDYNFGGWCPLTNAWHSLRIIPLDDAAKHQLSKVWHKKYQALLNYYGVTDLVEQCPAWARWKPHEWVQRPQADRFSFAAWEGHTLAGLINLRLPFPSYYSQELSVVYIEHVCTAP